MSGLYLHIPFCASRCDYCHFVSQPYERGAAARYEKALLREIRDFPAPGAEPASVDSIYFGGGTPSIFGAEPIAAFLQECRSKFPVAQDCEITIEANPGTISRKNSAAWRKSGVNRLSVGAQSFSDPELAAVGRTHSSKMAIDSVRLLREAGLDNISLDLMLGLPGQTRRSWIDTLSAVEKLGVQHVSVYMLDLDDPCRLRSSVEEGIVTLPEEDLVSDLYLETIEIFASHGYRQYEISNFARPGYACRHNLKYWRREPVLGFGLASHSFDGRSRWANVYQMHAYLDAVEGGKPARAWQEAINPDQALQETLFLGLRMAEGVDWNNLEEQYGAQRLSKYQAAIEQWLERGWILKERGWLRLMPSGMLLSNEIFQQFV